MHERYRNSAPSDSSHLRSFFICLSAPLRSGRNVPASVRRRSFAHVDIREDSSGKVGVGRSCNAVLVQSLLSLHQVVLAHGENPQFSPRGFRQYARCNCLHCWIKTLGVVVKVTSLGFTIRLQTAASNIPEKLHDGVLIKNRVKCSSLDLRCPKSDRIDIPSLESIFLAVAVLLASLTGPIHPRHIYQR